MRKWFQPEIDFLTRNWENYTAKEIGEILKFSEGAVNSMARKLGLKKSRNFKRQSMARASLMKQLSFHDKYILERLNGNFKGINYTTRPQSLGGGAERLFHSLVPDALDANESIHLNNPDFDFIYKDLTIDVKFSSAHRRKEGHNIHWSVRCSGNMDLIVAFLERKEGSELDEPNILIVPKGMFPREKIEIHQNGKYQKLFINKENLIEVLNKYQSLKSELGRV